MADLCCLPLSSLLSPGPRFVRLRTEPLVNLHQRGAGHTLPRPHCRVFRQGSGGVITGDVRQAGDDLLPGERVLWEDWPYRVTSYRVIIGADAPWSAYLDQLDNPVIRRHDDGSADVLLERARDKRQRRPAAVLRSLSDAPGACRVLAAARWRLLDGSVQIPAPVPAGTSTPVPAVISLAAGEQVLWTGRPQAVPWWFGTRDITGAVRGLVIVICAALAAAGVLTGHPAVSISTAPLYGIYLAAGRVLIRHRRISTSTYVLTSRRLITVWRRAGRSPVVVQASLRTLLPPELNGNNIYTTRHHRCEPKPGRNQECSLEWPACATHPPALIAIADPRGVRDLISTARLAGITRPPTGPAPVPGTTST
jgi:hypothetical protein